MRARIITISVGDDGSISGNRWAEPPFAESQLNLASKPWLLDEFMDAVRSAIHEAYDDARRDS